MTLANDIPIVKTPPIRPGKDWFIYVRVQSPAGEERPIWNADGRLDLTDDFGNGDLVVSPSIVACAGQEGEFAISMTGFETSAIRARQLRGVLTMVSTETETEDLVELIVPVEGADR